MKPEAIWHAANQQRLFRRLVGAYSRPGTIHDLTADLGGSRALQGALAALLDGETSLADPHDCISNADWQLLQCRRVSPESARFVAADGRRAPDFQPALGSLESPEFGATLLLEVDALDGGDRCFEINGPGIRGDTQLLVAGLHPEWLKRRADWNAAFPLGVDMVLVDAFRMLALPRTTGISQLKGEG